MNSSLIDSFSELLNRVPLSIIQKKFREFNLSAGRNTTDTLAKIRKMKKENDEDTIKILHKIIEWYFSDYFYHGERTLYLFQIDNNFLKNLNLGSIKSLSNRLKPRDHIFTHNFPISLDEESLKKVIDDIVLAHTETNHDATYLTYCSCRYFTNKVVIPKSELKEAAQEEYKNAEEITAVSHQFRQFFDLVVIHNNGLIEMRIDNPKMDNSKQIPVKERIDAFSKLLRAYEADLTKLSNKTITLPDPINLFPIIDDIYLKKGEGTVRALYFTTNNGGAKKLVADATNENDCCRNDTYHEGGSEKVNYDLNPYRIKLLWSNPVSKPQLHLLGTVRHLENKDIQLNEAIITRSERKSDYDNILSKLLSYIKTE